MNKQNKKTNPNLVELIDQLKEKSRETGSALWRDVAIRLSKSRKNWAQPNLSRLSRYAPEGAIVLIPEKDNVLYATPVLEKGIKSKLSLLK